MRAPLVLVLAMNRPSDLAFTTPKSFIPVTEDYWRKFVWPVLDQLNFEGAALSPLSFRAEIYSRANSSFYCDVLGRASSLFGMHYKLTATPKRNRLNVFAHERLFDPWELYRNTLEGWIAEEIKNTQVEARNRILPTLSNQIDAMKDRLLGTGYSQMPYVKMRTFFLSTEVPF